MLVSVALFEIHIPHAQTLKEKRKVVQSLKARLRTRLEVSAAEVAFQELHQRARIGVVCVTSDAREAQKVMAEVMRVVESEPDATLTGWTEESLEFEADAALDVPHFQMQEKFDREENP